MAKTDRAPTALIVSDERKSYERKPYTLLDIERGIKLQILFSIAPRLYRASLFLLNQAEDLNGKEKVWERLDEHWKKYTGKYKNVRPSLDVIHKRATQEFKNLNKNDNDNDNDNVTAVVSNLIAEAAGKLLEPYHHLDQDGNIHNTVQGAA